ncbi:MAG: methylenetetrahydrofolate reductase C-terminal domain-containing protein [Victivallales bacterium]|nr:methylenetetrahydrofolate reductase C-terminal domain-containing protein [Victivallales bacterium]
MSYDGLQLEMNFDPGQNRFRENLENGVFMLLFEQHAPHEDTDPEIAAGRLRELEYAVLKIKEIPAALALTDRFDNPDTIDASDLVTALSTDNRDRHLVYLSGRDSGLAEIAEKADFCIANGIMNVAAVSGNTYAGELPRENRRRRFTDSVHTIAALKLRKADPFYCGCTVNPYKYTPETVFPQYFKLMKKFSRGAAFAVTQVGWDMRKLQELRWYLDYRNQHFPTLARLLVLNSALLENIRRGQIAGVGFSANFQALLENELQYSYNQFEAAQWRRLELQVAGCRLMGYSGVQIAGLNSVDKINVAAQRVKKALAEFTVFGDWVQEYTEYVARTEMAPYPYKFYLFSELFSKAYPESVPAMNVVPRTALPERDKVLFQLRKFMFPRADKQIPGAHFLAKKLFASCQECSRCRLPQTFYICPELCPKGMANGPCGGTRPDGLCEHGGMECIYNRIVPLAAWRHKLHRLEETLVPPVERGA